MWEDRTGEAANHMATAARSLEDARRCLALAQLDRTGRPRKASPALQKAGAQ